MRLRHTTHLGVSPHHPSDKEINLLRDNRPTFGAVGSPCWLQSIIVVLIRTCPRILLLQGAHVCTSQKEGGDVDTRSRPLDRTASSSLQYFKAILAPRGHSEIIGVDPRECGYATQPTSVCLHTSHLTKRDYRPTYVNIVNMYNHARTYVVYACTEHIHTWYCADKISDNIRCGLQLYRWVVVRSTL